MKTAFQTTSHYSSASLLNAYSKDNSKHHFFYAFLPTFTGWGRNTVTGTAWAETAKPSSSGLPWIQVASQLLLPVSHDKSPPWRSKTHGTSLNVEQGEGNSHIYKLNNILALMLLYLSKL